MKRIFKFLFSSICFLLFYSSIYALSLCNSYLFFNNVSNNSMMFLYSAVISAIVILPIYLANVNEHKNINAIKMTMFLSLIVLVFSSFSAYILFAPNTETIQETTKYSVSFININSSYFIDEYILDKMVMYFVFIIFFVISLLMWITSMIWSIKK